MAAALILSCSLFYSTPFLRLLTSQWRSSCLRSSLIGRSQLSSSSSCPDIVCTGCLVSFFHIHAQLCSVVAGNLLIRWRTRWWHTKTAYGMVCPSMYSFPKLCLKCTPCSRFSTQTVSSTTRRSCISLTKNMRGNVIEGLSRNIKRSGVLSLVSDVKRSPHVKLSYSMTAAMNLPNLVQSLIIVSTTTSHGAII